MRIHSGWKYSEFEAFLISSRSTYISFEYAQSSFFSEEKNFYTFKVDLIVEGKFSKVP